MKMNQIETIAVSGKEDFRKWLEKNHTKETKVGVILHKRHTGKDAPTHRELMEEAISFGWIDTTVKRLDEDRYMRFFSKRNKNSKWSDNTLGYAKQIIKDGRMTEEGMKFYELGRNKPTHDHGIPKNPDMPGELERGLAKSKKIQKAFGAFSPSKKRMLYLWILRGKLSETREKRVRKIIDSIKSSSEKII